MTTACKNKKEVPLQNKKEAPNQNPIDHISVQIDHTGSKSILGDEYNGRLTITREKKIDEGRLKLDKNKFIPGSVFLIDSYGEWCRDFPIINMGVVRVVVDVKKHDISQIKKTEFLPINITLVVKGDVLVDRWMGIDPSSDKPLNKIVVNGKESKVELYQGENQPKIHDYSTFSPPTPTPRNKSLGTRDLFLRHAPRPPEIVTRICSKTGWMIKESYELPPPLRTLPFVDSPELKDIFFENEESSLNDANKKSLKKMIELLKNNPPWAIEIQGHADVLGKDRNYAIALGERRAKTVKDYLTANGVLSNLRILSYGKETPFCNESSKECRQKNNRVHFRLKRFNFIR
jgi:outer membrane protein OmpA-like peptidoglycan-associated protein